MLIAAPSARASTEGLGGLAWGLEIPMWWDIWVLMSPPISSAALVPAVVGPGCGGRRALANLRPEAPTPGQVGGPRALELHRHGYGVPCAVCPQSVC